MPIDERLAGEQYCYLTTTGRVSGKAHEIEIWFGVDGDSVYLLSGGGGRSDWVRNLRRTPAARLRIGDTTLRGVARVVDAGSEEDALARRLLTEKYQPGYERDLGDWRRTALPVAVDVEAAR